MCELLLMDVYGSCWILQECVSNVRPMHVTLELFFYISAQITFDSVTLTAYKKHPVVSNAFNESFQYRFHGYKLSDSNIVSGCRIDMILNAVLVQLL